MPNEADPPRKCYGFKEASFERLNAPRPEAPAVNASSPGETAPPADPNDVFAILQKNRVVEQQAGRDEIQSRNIKSRRMRDYWLILLPCETVLGTVAWFGRDNPMVWTCAVSGMVLIGAGLTWAMWQVMNKY
jgi:hypothetical protein